MELPKAMACEECGAEPILHRVTYYTILFDDLIAGLLDPGIFGTFFNVLFHAPERVLTPYLFQGLVRARLARLVDEPDEHTSLLGLTVWEEAKRQNIPMQEVRLFNLPRNIYLATLPNGRRIAFEGIPGLLGDISRVPWMDDKAVMKEKFIKLGFPVAAGGSVSSLGAAKRLFRKLRAPVIAKPRSGSFSRHTVMHIADETELARAFAVAHQVSPDVIIEEELAGHVYRATVVGGRLAATLRRDQPAVIGDGTSTVRELVAKENEHPHRRGPYFSPIKLEERAAKELAWQGLDFDSVPAEGQRVTLHQKINWTVGGTTTDATDDVHPDNRALFEDVARVVKGSIVGIDFMIDDIARSWKEQDRCGILECNSLPMFEHHHLPFYGQPRNVAADVWEMVKKAEGA